MQQVTLNEVLNEAGFSVITLEHHPKFFGNWRATFSRGAQRFEIVSDSREGWLTLWRDKPDGGAEHLFEIESSRLSSAEELATLSGWLQKV